jgi:hypothetical protein
MMQLDYVMSSYIIFGCTHHTRVQEDNYSINVQKLCGVPKSISCEGNRQTAQKE